MSGAAGPFETERDAGAAIGLPDWEPGEFRERTEHLLLRSCAAAGVELGAYDRRIMAWLAWGEPQAAAAIAGVILRAGGPA